MVAAAAHLHLSSRLAGTRLLLPDGKGVGSLGPVFGGRHEVPARGGVLVSIGFQKPASIGVQYPATPKVAEPVVQGVHGRVPRAPRSALIADAAARVGGACGLPWATSGWLRWAAQERFLNRQLSLPVSRMSQ